MRDAGSEVKLRLAWELSAMLPSNKERVAT
jgi:hypothetical protein